MFYKMSKNGEKCQSLFPQAQDATLDVLFCPDQQSTTQRSSLYCHRGLKKPEKIFTFKKLESDKLDIFSLKKWHQTINEW